MGAHAQCVQGCRLNVGSLSINLAIMEPFFCNSFKAEEELHSRNSYPYTTFT